MERVWQSLYKEAKDKLNTHGINKFIESGTSSCSILGQNGKIYTGISVTSTTNINTSAEKSAILAMFNDNEHIIKKIVILNELEEVILPSTDCLDYLLELGAPNEEIEVLVNYDKKEITTLSNLLPAWWGTYRNPK